MNSEMSSSRSSLYSNSMFRKIRRLRITAVLYTFTSLCCLLLFFSFNSELKRLLPTQESHFEQESLYENTLLSSRDVKNSLFSSNFPSSPSKSPSDENSQQAQVRKKLNLVAAGSLTQSPEEASGRPWYFWHGNKYPNLGTSTKSGLWSYESPTSDRIIEQLFYLTKEDVERSPKLESPSASYGFPFSGIFKNENESVIEVKEEVKLKNILLYYGLGLSWGPHIKSGRSVFYQQKCPVNTCSLSGSRAGLKDADVVVFKDVFMSPKGRRNLEQLWVMYMLECPLNTQNFMDKNLFNLTATYRHDSDIVTPYEKWVYYDESVKARKQMINYAGGKKKKVAWFVSNCVAKNNRLEYARELGKYIQVDIYGACGSHSCSRANAKQCFELLSKTYKFYLAFENSNCRDYISEKFFVNGLGNNVLPIVMGAHPDDYKRAAPYKSYIHVDDFSSPRELGKFLQKLDENDDLYNEYFMWKGTGEFINTHFFCRLCAMVHYADRTTSTSHIKSYANFNNWWRGPNVCTRRSWRNQVDIFSPHSKNSSYIDYSTTTSTTDLIIAS